ncbi:Gfo/Idh/MocA family oxidoreductase [Candidatus Bathyarchaeota archaeon]|nr:Gfo/Idh/MocA family oxidoreductase [Candidatus Bathyarchaeota archaeon]
MESWVGIGIVGLGFVGERAHLPSFRSIPSARLVAVADVDTERARRAAEKFKVKSAYSSHIDLVRDPEVDAVVISVPTFLHRQIAVDAARAGKHILCEMPLAPTLQEAQEIVDEAEAAGIIFMPSLNFRFTPNYVKVKELIASGSIGAPVAAFYREFIAAEELAQQWPANSWAWDEEKSGGGPGFTLSIWSIDLLRWLLQADIVEVCSFSRDVVLKQFGGTIGYNRLSVLKFSNGAVAGLEFSGLVRPAMSVSRLELLCDSLNSLIAEGNERVILHRAEPDRQEWIFREKGPRVWGHLQEDQHFVESILMKKRPTVTPEDALKAQEAAARIVNG